MSEGQTHCEVCGRFPAKPMTFRGHTGFVVVRRVTVVSGVFCRDCAIEAYAHARGISLKGMWFGTASLLIGTASSLWDSIKLLDLPPAVEDGPWVPHRVACPHCSQAAFVVAGLSECSGCSRHFVVSSCSKCGTIDVTRSVPDETTIRLLCKACNSHSESPLPARNSPKLLFGRGLVEIAVAMRDAGHPVEIGDWLAPYWELHEVSIAACDWLEAIYQGGGREIDDSILLASADSDQQPFLERLLAFSLSMCRDQQSKILLTLGSVRKLFRMPVRTDFR